MTSASKSERAKMPPPKTMMFFPFFFLSALTNPPASSDTSWTPGLSICRRVRENTYVCMPDSALAISASAALGLIADETSQVFRPMTSVSVELQYSAMILFTSSLQCSQSTEPSSVAMNPSRLHAAPYTTLPISPPLADPGGRAILNHHLVMILYHHLETVKGWPITADPSLRSG